MNKDKIDYIMRYEDHHGTSMQELEKMSEKEIDLLLEECINIDNEIDIYCQSLFN